MKHQYLTLVFSILALLSQAQPYEVNDTLAHALDEVSVVSFYRVNLRTGTTLSRDDITIQNKGQEPY